MRYRAKFLALTVVLLMPGNGSAEIKLEVEVERLKENGAEMHCTAKHDCNAPLDCGGDDFSDCKPREGYCDDPLSFAFQLLQSEDISDEKPYGLFALDGREKFVLSGEKIVLSDHQNKVLFFLRGQPPLDGYENWDVMFSDNGQIRVNAKLTSGIPSARSYLGTCQVGK